MIDYGCSGKRYQGCASRASAPGLDWAVENNSLHHVPMPVLQPILYPAFSRNYLDKHRELHRLIIPMTLGDQFTIHGWPVN